MPNNGRTSPIASFMVDMRDSMSVEGNPYRSITVRDARSHASIMLSVTAGGSSFQRAIWTTDPWSSSHRISGRSPRPNTKRPFATVAKPPLIRGSPPSGAKLASQSTHETVSASPVFALTRTSGAFTHLSSRWRSSIGYTYWRGGPISRSPFESVPSSRGDPLVVRPIMPAPRVPSNRVTREFRESWTATVSPPSARTPKMLLSSLGPCPGPPTTVSTTPDLDRKTISKLPPASPTTALPSGHKLPATMSSNS